MDDAAAAGAGPRQGGFVVLVVFAVVDLHSFRRCRATSCWQKLSHPRR